MGLLPIAIGIRQFLHRHESVEVTQVETEEPPTTPAFLSGLLSRHMLSVAAVTFANGGDNIGIYTPLFASATPVSLVVIVGVFLLLVGVWCYAGFRLAGHPAVAEGFSRHGHHLVPFVLVGLGFYILWESGSLRLLGL